MRRTLLLLFLSFLFLTSFYGGYRLLMKRCIIPSPPETVSNGNGTKRISQTTSTNEESAQDNSLTILKHAPHIDLIFPDSNDWRRTRAMFAYSQNKDGFILFKSFKNSLNNRAITLDSCNIVILAEDPDERERYRRAIVIETKGKTTLTFTKGFEFGGSFDFKTFESGKTDGYVTIRSAMQSPLPDDDLLLNMHGLSFNPTQLVSPGTVDFKFAGITGEGLNLTINLAFLSPGRNKSASNNKQVCPLEQIVEVGNLFNGIDLQRIVLNKLNKLIVKLDTFQKDKNPINTGNEMSDLFGSTDLKDAEVEIMCHQGVTIAPSMNEMGGWLARFMENVDVHFRTKDKQPDHLRCQNLLILLTDNEMRKMANAPENRLYLESMTRLKKKIIGRIQKLTPNVIEANRSEEAPVHVELPRFAFDAEGDNLTYTIATRSFHLKAVGESRRVRLTRDRSTILAERVYYEPGSKGEIGVFTASKNGQLVSEIGENGNVNRFRITWRESLRIANDPMYRDFVRIGMTGGISFHIADTGDVSAAEGDIWLLPGSAPQSRKKNSDETAGFGNLSDWKPQSAHFRGNIQMVTASGSGTIQDDLKVIFQEVVRGMPGMPANYGNGESPNAVTGTMARTQTGFGTKRSLIEGNKETKMNLEARKMALWILFDKNEKTVHKLQLHDNVVFHEGKTTRQEDSVDEIDIRGSFVEITNPNTDDMKISLDGENASFFGKGLRLIGKKVILEKKTNSFTVDGPGNLSFNIEEKNNVLNPGSVKMTGPLNVTWTKRLHFDGQTLKFESIDGANVIVSHVMHTLKCPEVHLTTQNKVDLFDFDKKSRKPGAFAGDIALIECVGNLNQTVKVSLYLDSPVKGSDSKPVIERAHYEGEVSSFILDYLTKKFIAQGPGWFRGNMKMSTNIGSKSAIVGENSGTPMPVALGNTGPVAMGQIGNLEKAATLGRVGNNAVPNAGTPMAPGQKTNATSAIPGGSFQRKPWGHIHLCFQDQASGNIEQKVVTFYGTVQVAYCETDDPKTALDVSKPAQLPPKSLLLNSKELHLLLAGSGGPNVRTTENSFEMFAVDNVFVSYDSIIGRGNSLTYTNSKRRIVLKGAGNEALAYLYEQKEGMPSTEIGSFQSASYDLETGELVIADFANKR